MGSFVFVVLVLGFLWIVRGTDGVVFILVTIGYTRRDIGATTSYGSGVWFANMILLSSCVMIV